MDKYIEKMQSMGLIRCPNCLDWHKSFLKCECEKNMSTKVEDEKERARIAIIEQILRDMQNCVHKFNTKKENDKHGATKT